MVKSILVSNIVRYAIHDGKGLRTTVFLKGCTLHCPWCANPETINQQNEVWFRADKCVGTEDTCAFQQNCNRVLAKEKAGKAIKNEEKVYCPVNALTPVAEAFEPDELYLKIKKDKVFWGKNGGVTFSGGEPLLQFAALRPVLDALKQDEINIVFETAGCIKNEVFSEMLQYADGVYLDIKNVLPDEAAKTTGANIELYLENLCTLDASGVDYCLRMPLIKPYTFNQRNINEVCRIISGLNSKRIEIFSCHNLGNKKRKWLGKRIQIPTNVSDNDVENLKAILERIGTDVTMLRI